MARLNASSIAGAILLVFWLVMFAAARLSPFAGKEVELAYDALLYPSLLIWLGLALSATLLAVGLLHAPPAPAPGDSPQDRKALLAMGSAIAYLALLIPLGFLIDTLLFMVIFAAAFGYRRWHVLIPVSLATTGAIWLLFNEGLKAPLPGLPGAF